MSAHAPVMLHEVLQYLVTDPQGFYVDGTFGRGGHSRAILKQLAPEGLLLVGDRDPEALVVAQQLQAEDSRVLIHEGPFSNLHTTLEGLDWTGQVQGLFLDLGVSSPQLDTAERGFSFQLDGPLDMRMDLTQTQTAATLVNTLSQQELSDLFKTLGEEKFHWRIAGAIVAAREEAPLQTTLQLAQLIEDTVPRREHKKHPATRVFMALRIAVNRELDEISHFLEQCLDQLAVGGRLAVLSFHSLEDRIVKRFIQQHSPGNEQLRILSMTVHLPELKRIKKLKASAEECQRNRRARSAVLRVAEKCR